jgi:phosphate:Na+ symporter
MGSNIGTTVTAWLLSLTGIESDNIIMNMLKPKNFSPVLALIGVLLIMAAKKQRRKDVGTVLIGFAILMTGMELMSGAVKPLAEIPEFTSLMTSFSNPILGILFGAVFTAVIQSSSASVGILQALALTGAVPYSTAIPVIMGQNIGTCITAIISSLGANNSARRVSIIHISFNVLGTLIFSAIFYGINAFFPLAIMNQAAGVAGIAICHTIFNVFTTMSLLPFANQLERLARKLIKDDNKKIEFAFLDPLLLRTPSVAVNECVAMANRMGEVAHQNLLLGIEQLSFFSEARETQMLENEEKLDIYEDRLSDYLVQISQHGVSADDSQTVSRLLHAIGDFERIGDHALNLQESAKEIHDKGVQFSASADAELNSLLSALIEIMDYAFKAFSSNDSTLAKSVEPLEETIDHLTENIRLRHIRRLQAGECTVQLGFIHSDLLTNFERVSDHCSNIALSVLEAQNLSLDRHAYLHDLKKDSDFTEALARCMEKYQLPKM